jgi:acetyl esterase
MPLHPQVEGILTAMAEEGGKPIAQMTVEEARGLTGMLAELGGEPATVGDVRDVTIPVDGGEIPARVYSPDTTGIHPIVVFYHGGGWVIGDLDSHDRVARQLCNDVDAVVVVPHYRMGPEFRFPTAPQDCAATLRWVVDNAGALDADGSRVALCGDSAGGNLTAVVSQMARDAGGPAVAFQAMVYPATNMTAEGGSLDENATGYFLERDDIGWFMDHYIDEDDRKHPLASPALHGDLGNLPPAFITTCEFDPLRDDGEAYGAALAANGVPVEVKRYDGMIHGVLNMTGVIDGGREMLSDVASRLRDALH